MLPGSVASGSQVKRSQRAGAFPRCFISSPCTNQCSEVFSIDRRVERKLGLATSYSLDRHLLLEGAHPLLGLVTEDQVVRRLRSALA